MPSNSRRCHTVTGRTEATLFLAVRLVYTALAVDTTFTVYGFVIDRSRYS